MYIAKVPKLFQPFQCNNLIRLGKDNDGGYLVNLLDLQKTKKLVSFGVGEDLSFEKQFLELNNCAFSAYDKTAKVDLSFFTGDKKLFFTNVDRSNLYDILVHEDIFLKCDIEGNEYGILDDLISLSSKFTGIVIEFHSINEGNNLGLLMNFISKVKQKLVHAHVNNYFYYKTDRGNIPDILELTFTMSENITYEKYLMLPHKLDMPNNINDLDFKLDFG